MDKLLRESGIPFEKVNYYIQPLSKKKLNELLRKMNMKPRDLLRKSEPVYKELGLAEDKFSDSELIAMMVEHPDLIQRPIVERGRSRGARASDGECEGVTLKKETVFICQHCGHKVGKWLGKCPECGEWNSLVEEKAQISRRSGSRNGFQTSRRLRGCFH